MKSIYILMLSCIYLLLSAGCASQKSTMQDNGTPGLVGTYWKLMELNGQPVPAAENDKKEMHILLKSADNTLSAFAGCNGVGGKYELKDGMRITFSNMISTMMACPEMETENAFKKMLETVDNYAISGNQLSLNKARMAPLARFVAVSK